MPKCMRKGCGQEYEENNNTETSCHYHSGAPVFHEGLKSWSCCSDMNKPVLDFESFVKIPGCTKGSHSQEKPKAEPPTSGGGSDSGTNTLTNAINLKMNPDTDGRETYMTTPISIPAISNTAIAPQETAPPKEEEDDLSVPVQAGTQCKRSGCGAKFVSNEENRLGDGEGTKCIYHSAPPIFREGSKGYLCCKRRVLEFDEFLKIKGCKTGRHLFAPKQSSDLPNEQVICRIDHYQTPSEVHVSVFAKQTDKATSMIQFEETKLHLNLYMPGSKLFRRTLDLYGPIDPQKSKYTFFGTKVELILAKADNRSWLLLEKTNQDTAGYNLTFGVGGRTGTVGAKELVLSEDNKMRLT